MCELESRMRAAKSIVTDCLALYEICFLSFFSSLSLFPYRKRETSTKKIIKITKKRTCSTLSSIHWRRAVRHRLIWHLSKIKMRENSYCWNTEKCVFLYDKCGDRGCVNRYDINLDSLFFSQVTVWEVIYRYLSQNVCKKQTRQAEKI